MKHMDTEKPVKMWASRQEIICISNTAPVYRSPDIMSTSARKCLMQTVVSFHGMPTITPSVRISWNGN